MTGGHSISGVILFRDTGPTFAAPMSVFCFGDFDNCHACTQAGTRVQRIMPALYLALYGLCSITALRNARGALSPRNKRQS